MGIDAKSAAEFGAKMREFALGMRMTMVNVAREQARLICRDAMIFTPPMPPGGGQGLSVDAHKSGKRKVASDISRILLDPKASANYSASQARMNTLIYGVKSDNFRMVRNVFDLAEPGAFAGMSGIMQKIAADPDPVRQFSKAKNFLSKARQRNDKFYPGFVTDLRSIHDQAMAPTGGRFRKGYVYRGMKYLVQTKAQLMAYIEQRQQMVGHTKAGWLEAQAAIPLPTRRNGAEYNAGVVSAGWLTRHRPGVGAGNERSGGQTVYVQVLNRIGNINGIADEAGTEGIVYGNRVAQMGNQLDKQVKREIARANARR